MITWSVTAHTNTHTGNGVLLANATDNYNAAHRAAGEAALAALAGQEPTSVPFICISIDNEPLLLAAAAQNPDGTVDFGGLAAGITSATPDNPTNQQNQLVTNTPTDLRDCLEWNNLSISAEIDNRFRDTDIFIQVKCKSSSRRLERDLMPNQCLKSAKYAVLVGAFDEFLKIHVSQRQVVFY